MTEELKEALKNHMEADQRTFDSIGQTLDKIKDNHLFHIEKSQLLSLEY